jgi:uncharacterized protein YfbU (UPF0304 family)
MNFDPPITKNEALLFTDDLTMPVGHVPRFITTLQLLAERASAVCLLEVDGVYYGTGFRVGPDLVLTNEHVLFPNSTKAKRVLAKFGYDVDGNDHDTTVVTLEGDVASIVGDAKDDWAVVKVANMDPAWSQISLVDSPAAQTHARAFILQHPGTRKKRLGFVRNMITDVTDQYVQYMTDTQPGSSGSPVFDEAARLIALHHRGGTPTQYTGKAPLTKNQGVRIDRVYAGMKAKNVVA